MSAFLLGGLGALLGMSVIRHKTQHVKFKMLVPIAAFLTLIVMMWITGDLTEIIGVLR